MSRYPPRTLLFWDLTLLGRQAVVCQAEHYRQERYLKEQRPEEGHRLFLHQPLGWLPEFVFLSFLVLGFVFGEVLAFAQGQVPPK